MDGLFQRLRELRQILFLWFNRVKIVQSVSPIWASLTISFAYDTAGIKMLLNLKVAKIDQSEINLGPWLSLKF